MAANVTVIPASRIREIKKKEKETVRVAAYCRVSTEQEEQLGSFENQVEYYNSLINQNPGWQMAGIFTDEGISGTGTKKRAGFQKMIRACDEGKVDMVITKSISRFARNTADCLYYSRHLKKLGIPVVFEKENINTMDASGELLFTILSSLAQEESRNISENTQWGIRSKFQQGTPHINADRFMGYDKDENGRLVINEKQAAVVRRIFARFLEGWTPAELARHLNREGVPGVSGEAKWAPHTIAGMLQNEKYKGDLLMQKFYTVSYLTKQQAENDGKLDQYFVENDHKAIISRDDWEAVQLELKRRKEFRSEHKLSDYSTPTGNPFFSKVFSGKSGERYVRTDWKGNRIPAWRCASDAVIKETDLRKAMAIAWNSIVEKRSVSMPAWEKKAEEGDALEKLRARQMIELTAEGTIENEIPELTRMVLKEITVIDPHTFRIAFLDGSERTVSL